MDAEFEHERKRMVEQQLLRRGISDPSTLSSMLAVPRHDFVPVHLKGYAYNDGPLPIGEGQTISQPYIVALMTQSAELAPDAAVLEIGTGSGYAAAILSRIVKHVFTVERIPSLAHAAEICLHKLGYDNVEIKIGDGSLGWPEKGPFDAILVTAGAPVVPEALIKQLKEGGRLIIPVGDAYSQELLRVRKLPQGKISRETIEFVRFVPLIGEEGWKP